MQPHALPFQSRFSTITIHECDRLQLMNFTPPEIKDIENVIRASWRPDDVANGRETIQGTRCISYAYEIQLCGKPWYSAGHVMIRSCVLIRDLLAFLFSQGWILGSPTSVSSKSRHCETLIFRKQLMLPPKSEWLAVKFEAKNELYLIGASNDLIKGMRAPLKEMGSIDRMYEYVAGAHVFKFGGTPWSPQNEENVPAPMWIMKLLETLEGFGWSLSASVRQDLNKRKDTWYLVRTVD